MVNAGETTSGAITTLGDLINAIGVWGCLILIAWATWAAHAKYKKLTKGKKDSDSLWRFACRKLIAYLRVVVWAGRLGIGPRLAYRLQPERWRQMCQDRGFVGLKRGKVRRTRVGVDINASLNGKMTSEYIRTNVSALETGLGVKKGSIRIVDGVNAHRIIIRITTRQAVPAVLEMDIPQGRVSIKDPYQFAVNQFGEWTEIKLQQRILFVGASGSGKSSVQRVAATPVILAEDADLEIWDFKYGAESQHYEGKVLHRIIDADQGIARIEELLTEELEQRAAEMKRLKTSTWPTSPTHPDLIIMIDENAAAIRGIAGAEAVDEEGKLVKGFGAKKLKRLFTLMEQARAFGVYIWAATQFPKSENLPTEMRSQFTCVVALKMKRASESRIVFEDDVRYGWEPHKLPDVGWCLIHDDDHPDPEHYKLPWIKDTDFRTKVHRVKTHPHEPDVSVTVEKPVSARPVDPSSRERFIRALDGTGEKGLSIKELEAALGLSQARVYKLRDALLDTNHIIKAGRGRVALAPINMSKEAPSCETLKTL